MLHEAHALAAAGRVDRGLDRLFLHVDDLLLAGDLSEVDAMLRAIDCDAFGDSLLVGALTITSAARDELTERAAFVRRVRERLTRVIADRDELEDTLQGLE
jgi:hypothetical protein